MRKFLIVITLLVIVVMAFICAYALYETPIESNYKTVEMVVTATNGNTMECIDSNNQVWELYNNYNYNIGEQIRVIIDTLGNSNPKDDIIINIVSA